MLRVPAASDLLGCLLCMMGGTVIVLGAPRNSVDVDVDVFLNDVQEPAFMLYMAVLAIISCVMLGFQVS